MPTKFYNLDVDTTLGGNSPSDNVVPSQKAIKTYVDNNSGGGSVAIDGTTITKNSSDQIQAVATVNANTAAGATNPVYDWVGTLAEYTTQNIESTHPDWLCFITDDTTANAYEAYSKTQSDNLFVAKGHEVIEFQEPTALNNYTWYRKYADGWVEQGGSISSITYTSHYNNYQVNLPITMQDTEYTVFLEPSDRGYVYTNNLVYGTLNTTNFIARSFGTGGTVSGSAKWMVCGMAAA